MTRWIVAGVLIAVLVVVIVSDELSYTPGSPEIAAAPEAPNDPAFGEPDGVPDPRFVEPQAEPDDGSTVRLAVHDDCAQAVARLESVQGKPYADKVGDALWSKQGATPDTIKGICKDLNAIAEDDAFVAATAEASGVAP